MRTELQPWLIGEKTFTLAGIGVIAGYELSDDRWMEPTCLPPKTAVRVVDFRVGGWTDVEVTEPGGLCGRRIRMATNRYLDRCDSRRASGGLVGS